MSLKGRVAIVTGATRGIGRALALAFAAEGADVVVTGKTVAVTPGLSGTIHSVADEVEKFGVRAFPAQLDVRDSDNVRDVVRSAARELGPPAILVNNASALWWKPIEQTPIERYDLIMGINARGTFATTQACLKYMREAGFGHVITQSPPVTLDKLKGMTAYSMSKFGMTLVALGVAAEYKGMGVAGNSIWPTTLIESAATRNHQLGDERHWRKADILVDAIMSMVQEDPNTFTGNQLLDEPYLRSKGVTDFTKYRCRPDYEPPSINEVGSLVAGAGDRSTASKQ